MLVARQQEVELGLEGGPGSIEVEGLEERVVDVFEDRGAFEVLGEHLDKGGLSGADRSVDGQIPIRERVQGHRRDYTISRNRYGSEERCRFGSETTFE